MKTNFENIGGSYSQQGDYLLPTLTLPDENQRQISVWAMRHRRYLKSSHRVLYYNLLTSGKLYNYLADVELQAENLFEQTIKSLAGAGTSYGKTQSRKYDVVGAKDE